MRSHLSIALLRHLKERRQGHCTLFRMNALVAREIVHSRQFFTAQRALKYRVIGGVSIFCSLQTETPCLRTYILPVHYPELFIETFKSNITIASVCNSFFRRNILTPNTMAYIPEEGYNREKNQSYKALQWLDYIRKSQNIVIRDAHNGGEKKIGNYFLDGYMRGNQIQPTSFMGISFPNKPFPRKPSPNKPFPNKPFPRKPSPNKPFPS